MSSERSLLSPVSVAIPTMCSAAREEELCDEASRAEVCAAPRDIVFRRCSAAAAATGIHSADRLAHSAEWFWLLDAWEVFAPRAQRALSRAFSVVCDSLWQGSAGSLL